MAADKEGHTGHAFRAVSLPPAALARSKGLVRIEGEAFAAGGGGQVKVCNTGDASGKSISYWHKSIGHWVEWDLDVPAEGRYEVWMRYTTACAKTRRSLQIDGVTPAPAFASMVVPCTGGWSGTESQWRYLRLGVPIVLRAGRRRLRMTNLADGLGVDFLVLRALP